MKNLIKTAAAAVMLVTVAGCQGNDAIPKLASIEEFEGENRIQSLGDAAVFTMPKIDILFVVDNSGSMGPIQERLSENIDLFLDELRRVDRLSYRVAVVTSGDDTHRPASSNYVASVDLGRFFKKDSSEPGYITNSTPNGQVLLKERLTPGINGNSKEVFFEAALNALTDPDQSDFVREDAYLAIFFVTDAEDISTTLTWEMLSATLIDIKRDPAKIMAYGALIPSHLTSKDLSQRKGCSRDSQGPPVNIETFIEEHGGKIFDLCESDFGLEMARVGRELGNAIESGSMLEDIPDPRTIRVFANDIEIPNDPKKGWMYLPDSNSILFGRELEVDSSNSQIIIQYTSATTFRN